MTTSSNHPIIGISGTFASGKDTVAHYLVKDADMYHVSTGDIVRAVAMEEFGNVKRQTLHDMANKLRNERGSGVLIELALDAYQLKKNVYKGGIVISGIRSIGEAKAIQQAGGILVFVDAPIKARYERIKERQRADEHVLTFEEFKASEKQEMQHEAGSTDPALQNIAAVKELADVVVMNDGTLEEFVKKAKQSLRL